MSIVAYVGLPRHGKSYTAVENVILPALRQGRHVVTNIPLYVERIREEIPTGTIAEFPIQAVQAAPDTVFDYALPGCVLVLDEVWRLWPSGVKSNDVPEPFRKLLAEHGHMVDAAGNSMQVVLVTQDLSQIGAFARKLVEQTFHTVKLSHLGISKRYRLSVYHGEVTGAVPPVSKRLREVYGSFSPKVYRLYKSHTLSESSTDGANEAAIDRRFVVWRSPVWWLGAPAVLCLGIWGVVHAVGVFGGKETETAAAVGGRPSPSQGQRGASARGPGLNALSIPARVTGFLDVDGDPSKSIVMLSDGVRTWSIRFSEGCSWHRHREIVCTWDGRTFRGTAAGFVPSELRGHGA